MLKIGTCRGYTEGYMIGKWCWIVIGCGNMCDWCVNGYTVNYDHIHDMLNLTQSEVADFRHVRG